MFYGFNVHHYGHEAWFSPEQAALRLEGILQLGLRHRIAFIKELVTPNPPGSCPSEC